MDPFSLGLLTAIGLLGGFMAGLLGVGGGIVIIPLLVYGAGVPVSIATGVSMVQAFFATVSGVAIHHRNQVVDWELGATLGVAGVLGALIGSFGSARLSADSLLTIYLSLVILALALLFLAPRRERPRATKVNPWVAIPLGFGVGILAGMLGVGGGFIMTPLLITALHVPTRTAVGTSLVMIIPTTFFGSIGKIATGQFDLGVAAVVVVGSILGAQAGARVNARIPPRAIHAALALVLLGILIRTGIDLIST